MYRRPKIILILLTLGFISGLLAACIETPPPPATPAPTPTPGQAPFRQNVLRIILWQAPTQLNPHLAQGDKDWQACRITYEPLASYDKDGQLIPFLAAEIPSLANGGIAADGRSVTWKLKRDVFWSDGEPFTADDVLFTYAFITNPATNAVTARSYGNVETINALDPYTVQIVFSDVNPAWDVPFVGISGMILPRHAFAGYTDAALLQAPVNTQPVGTGPYYVERFRPEEVLFLGSELIPTYRIIYKPNPFFREGRPFFDRIDLKGGGTVDAAVSAVFETGEYDYAYNAQLDAATLEALEANSEIGQLVAVFGPYVERILLNRTDPNQATADGERSSLQFPHPFFSDEADPTNSNVRRAFSLAIDREAIAVLYGPTGKVATNNLEEPPTYRSPNTSYVFDPAQAQALLEAAGWIDSDGDGIRERDGVKLSVSFQSPVNPVRQATQQIVKQNLEAIGVEVTLDVIDSSTFFSTNPTTENPRTRWHFYADMQIFSSANQSPDPGEYLGRWTCTQRTQKANNWGNWNNERWCDPAYDRLNTLIQREIDPTVRQGYIIEMNDMLIEDVVMIPLVHRANVSAVQTDIVGVDLTPWDAEFWNIKDWRRVTP